MSGKSRPSCRLWPGWCSFIPSARLAGGWPREHSGCYQPACVCPSGVSNRCSYRLAHTVGKGEGAVPAKPRCGVGRVGRIAPGKGLGC